MLICFCLRLFAFLSLPHFPSLYMYSCNLFSEKRSFHFSFSSSLSFPLFPSYLFLYSLSYPAFSSSFHTLFFLPFNFLYFLFFSHHQPSICCINFLLKESEFSLQVPNFFCVPYLWNLLPQLFDLHLLKPLSLFPQLP